MKRFVVLIAVLGLAACQPKEPELAGAPLPEAAPAPAPTTVEPPPLVVGIPVKFQGKWDASLEACAEEYSDMRLVIDATNMRFWESEGSPTKVEPAGVNAIVVDSDFSGEGDTWTARYRFALADGGETLMVDSVKRVRCEVEK